MADYNPNDAARLKDVATLTVKVQTALGTKVDKVDGKQLSTEDYTTVEKTKLAGIETGAQVNVIEKITVDGTEQTVTNKIVALDMSDYAKKSDLSSIYRVKGTVANFAALPSNAEVGDVYNITAAGGTDENGVAIKAGDNVVKTATGWDNLGGTVDLSGHIAKVAGATAGNIAVFAADGSVIDSGIKIATDAEANAMFAEYFPD